MTPEQGLELQALKETMIACYMSLGKWTKYYQDKYPGEDPVVKAREHLRVVLERILSADPTAEAAAGDIVQGDPLYCYLQFQACIRTVPQPPDCYQQYQQCLVSGVSGT